MTTYTITSYNDGGGLVNTDWTYHVTNAPASGDTVLLGSDIGSSGAPLTALSAITIPTGATFDGQGYKIYINISSFASSFDLTGGTVQNLGIDCSSTTLASTVGYIGSANSYGNVYNCHTDGNLSDSNGGIFGVINGTVNIERCTWSGSCEGQFSGGIMATTTNDTITITINECYTNVISMPGTDNWRSGIVGTIYQGTVVITNCYSFGDFGTHNTVAGIATIVSIATGRPVTITDCYTTDDNLIYSGNATASLATTVTNCIAATIIAANESTINAGSANNSIDLTDIQGVLGGPATSWNSSPPDSVWVIGSNSDYPMLYQFNTGPWTGYTIYTDNATLTGGYEGGNARGDPHITTLFGRTYDYGTLGFSRYFDNCNSDNRLVINCEIRKKVIYNRWRSKRYIRRCSIITPKSYIEIKTGFRGEKVRIIKSNIDPSEDITIEENKLTFNNDAMRHCTKCTFDTADNDNALDHEMDNKYHKILQWERNAIRIKIKLDQEYIIDFENVNADNLQPGKIGFNCMNRSNINSYKGLIVDDKWVPYCILENIECEKDLQIDNIMIK